MCGIAAFFAYHNAAKPVSREELRAVRDHMQRRGPEGAGEWFSSDQRVALGHRRLAIIDLSEAGSQPMFNAKGTVAVVFNGEIYNYKTLRVSLEKKGYRFRSNSDTEVLLYLYEEKKEQMVHDLRGMFAFALWDDTKRTLFLARDPYGIKPLYYSDDGQCFRAASQVKALLRGANISKAKDAAGAVGFLMTGSVPEPYTLYQSVRQVPAGSFMTVDAKGVSDAKKYFSVSQIFSESAKSEAESESRVQSCVTEALLDSVRHHLVSDVPVGLFLSGGIDSGALLGLIREEGRRDVACVTLGFDEYAKSAEDEVFLARQTAGKYGFEHQARVLSQTEFKEDLTRVFDGMDQPSIDGINTYFISKAVKGFGLKVALSGLGADELFGGYPSFQTIPKWAHSLSLASRVPGLGQAFQKAFPAAHFFWPSLSPKSAGVFLYGRDYPGVYFLKRGLFMPWEIPQVLDKDFAREGARKLNMPEYFSRELKPEPIGDFAKVATLEACYYMRNQLLRDADWAGMAHSVEIRTPFVDSHLLKKLAPLLGNRRLHVNKRWLAQSPSIPLPDAVLAHPKTGFTVPIHRWLESDKGLEEWRSVPLLKDRYCPWARRWAYVVYSRMSDAA